MTFAMVFPGQGSQAVGMLAEMAQTNDVVKDTFGQAGEVLKYNLWDIALNGPKEKLDQTHITQPAILTASVALWRIWCEQSSARPVAMAGHSLGEFSALVCAGVLDFDAAVALVSKRGELMQAAVPEDQGAMAVLLGLQDEQIIDLCTQVAQGDIVEAVNFNAPGQVVIAGDRDAVQRAIVAAKEAGARMAKILPISVPAHSSLMRPASVQFAKELEKLKFKEALYPVLQNVGIDSVADVKDALVKQLYSPVPWTNIINALAKHNITHVVECGPGEVLCGLNRRIDKSIQRLPLYTPDAMASAVTELSG